MVQKIKERLILLLESGYVTLRNSEHDICVANIDLANAGELKSSDLKAYIESLGVKIYFSMAYEQHQNGPAKSSINSIMLLNRIQMVE